MTALVLEIPLSPEPQTFTIPLNGHDYQMRLLWCDAAQSWSLDLSDQYGNPLAMGLPLVTGVDLLGQLAYLGIGGSLVVQSDFDPDEVPTFDSLGSSGHLFFISAQ